MRVVAKVAVLWAASPGLLLPSCAGSGRGVDSQGAAPADAASDASSADDAGPRCLTDAMIPCGYDAACSAATEYCSIVRGYCDTQNVTCPDGGTPGTDYATYACVERPAACGACASCGCLLDSGTLDPVGCSCDVDAGGATATCWAY